MYTDLKQHCFVNMKLSRLNPGLWWLQCISYLWKYICISLGDGLVSSTRQSISWTNVGAIHWRVYASPGLSVLIETLASFKASWIITCAAIWATWVCATINVTVYAMFYWVLFCAYMNNSMRGPTNFNSALHFRHYVHVNGQQCNHIFAIAHDKFHSEKFDGVDLVSMLSAWINFWTQSSILSNNTPWIWYDVTKMEIPRPGLPPTPWLDFYTVPACWLFTGRTVSGLRRGLPGHGLQSDGNIVCVIS